MSTLRLPMVMAVAGREMTSPETVWGGQQDTISVRDAGWIQIYVENNQEILDMIIQGYKLSENKKVLLPVNICYDGFYLSHLTERVEIPDQEKVDMFLPRYSSRHVILDPENPMAIDPLTPGHILMKYRKNHLEAMQNVFGVLEEVDKEFEKEFGRSYGGEVEEYRCKDADIVLITMGSMTGTAKEAVDMEREKGIMVGLIKIRLMRPFPKTKISNILKDKKAFAVIDRNVIFGWNTGALYMETMAAISNIEKTFTTIPVIAGLGGVDITLDRFIECINHLDSVKESHQEFDCLWWID